MWNVAMKLSIYSTFIVPTCYLVSSPVFVVVTLSVYQMTDSLNVSFRMLFTAETLAGLLKMVTFPETTPYVESAYTWLFGGMGVGYQVDICIQ